MQFPRLIPQNFLGIDVGTSAIKIVELSNWAGRIKLENYGEIASSALYQKPFRTFEKNYLLLSAEDISRAIKAVLEEAKTKTLPAVFSIPDFSTFFTTFELPPMTREELPQAVRAEASCHIPLPLGEITLDWQVLSGGTQTPDATKLKILLVAVPNEVINQYRRIASMAGLKLLALEAEVFGLARSLIDKDDKTTIGIIDIGARSTTCSIIGKRVLKTSHSFDIGGADLTERIVQGLSLDYKLAEDLKRKYGILTPQSGLEGKNTGEILIPLINLIAREIEKVFQNYRQKEGKEIEKIILAGANALLPGLLEYFQNYFKKEGEIANPFAKIFFPPILENVLKEMGPAYAIAVGMALRGLE